MNITRALSSAQQVSLFAMFQSTSGGTEVLSTISLPSGRTFLDELTEPMAAIKQVLLNHGNSNSRNLAASASSSTFYFKPAHESTHSFKISDIATKETMAHALQLLNLATNGQVLEPGAQISRMNIRCVFR